MADAPTLVDLVTCGSCSASVSPGRFCGVCGARLEASREPRGFAASPDQPVLLPHPVSTLLPRLPRADLDAFGLALGLGTGLVAVLAALGYYAVALVTGAALVPLLLLVYLVAVDVYEDEPLRVLLLTLGWGAVTGAIYALLLRALFPATDTPFATVDDWDQVLRGVLLPAVATAVMIAGPLLLLPYRRFNDVLDGATFGALSGAGFVGAQIVVQSLDLLEAGLRPGGDAFDWVLRVVIHGVVMPLVAAGAIGGACASLWLRFRAPGHEARSLGLLGNPVIALILAGLLVVAANLAILHLRDIPRLLALAALALAALLWLRLVIHVGLRQEAVEAALADERPCQNCGRATPPGSFCRECGVSLRALPKRAPGAAAGGGEAGVEPRFDEPIRISGTRSMLLFLAGLGAAAALVAIVVAVLAPTPIEPVCDDPTAPCPVSASRLASDVPGPVAEGGSVAVPAGEDRTSGLAVQQAVADPMRFGTTHRDEQLGWEIDYGAGWTVDAAREPGVAWIGPLRFEVVPATTMTASQMLDHLVGWIGGVLESETEVRDHGRSALAPHIGYVPAEARYLEGDAGEAGAITHWGAYALVASDGFHTAGVVIFVSDPDATEVRFRDKVRRVRALGDWYDDLLKRFYWPDPARTPGAQATVREHGAPLMPDEFRRGWGIDRLHELGLRGEGQTVAIYSRATFVDADMDVWDTRTGTVGPPVERMVIGGEPTLNGATGEVLLDLQTVRSIAPQARIVNVEVAGDAWYPEALDAIIEDGRADIVSISYGGCEAYYEYWRPDDGRVILEEDARELLEWLSGRFQAAADADLTVFASSGDEGVYGCVRGAPEPQHGIVSPIYPSSIPSVVSVGGTLLWRNADGTYQRETAWTQPLEGEGTGGGASRFFPMPEWQQRLGLEGSMRITPDVSGPADPDTGIYWLFRCGPEVGDTCRDDICEANLCVGGGGGTSQAAPFWAGVTALLRQAAEQEGLLDADGDGASQLPWLLPLLYEVAADRPDAFRDVVAGSNFLHQATPGWDAATGLGSPEVPVFVEAMLERLRAGAG